MLSAIPVPTAAQGQPLIAGGQCPPMALVCLGQEQV